MNSFKQLSLLLCVSFVLIVPMAYGQTCNQSISEQQLRGIDRRLDNRLDNLTAMSNALFTAAERNDSQAKLELDRVQMVAERLISASEDLWAGLELLDIRDAMHDDRDRRYVIAVVERNFQRLQKRLTSNVEHLNKILTRTKLPGVVSEMSGARDVLTELSFALRACASK